MLKIQIQTPVLPSHEVIAKLLPVLRKVVKDNKAEVLFHTDKPGCDFYCVVLKNNSEQTDLAIDCQKALFNHFFSKIN